MHVCINIFSLVYTRQHIIAYAPQSRALNHRQILLHEDNHVLNYAEFTILELEK